MTALASASIFGVVLDAMEGIDYLSGSKRAPAIVARYDKARRQTAELPAIQIRRLSEDRIGDDDGSDQFEITTNGEICLYLQRDEGSSESYDEIVEADIGDLLTAFYAAAWAAVLGDNPILNVSWTPLQVQVEDEPEDGAVISFAIKYRGAGSELDVVKQPFKE